MHATLQLNRATPAPISLGGIKITELGEIKLNPQPKTLIYSTLNAEIYQLAQERLEFKSLLNHEASRVCIDGQWVLWALRRKYGKDIQLSKNSGSELIFQVPEHCADSQMRLALLGASGISNQMAVARLKSEYPSLVVSGHSPPFSSLPLTREFHASIQSFLEDARPDIIVCAFGPPKEQVWAFQNLDQLNALGVSVVLCFGGALDMLSGQVSTAPSWMKRAGLEAVYRTWKQPNRVARLPRVLRFLKTVLFGDGSRQN